MTHENQFTPRAEEALRLAQEAAEEMGHGYVGCEHILLGLMREEDGIAHRVMQEYGMTEDMICTVLERSVGKGLSGAAPSQGLTPRAKSAVELAVSEAMRMGAGYIGTEHLLMGLLREGNNMAIRVLDTVGIDPKKMYSSVVQKINEGPRAATNGSMPVSHREESKKAKTLAEFTRDLTEAARQGKLDPVIGREKEIQRVIQILSRRTKNNPVLIGEPGVGKTAIAEGLAQRIAAADVPEELLDKKVLSLDLSRMASGTTYRGDFEEPIKQTIDEVKKERGMGVAHVSTERGIDEAQKKEIEERLLATTHFKKMEMHYQVEDDLIGGMVIRIGDRVVDSSVKAKLYELQRQLLRVQL